MFTFRTVAIVTIGAGAFAGLPLTDAHACDNDRFPCPVVSEVAPQETADVPAKPARSAQPRKNANHSARSDKKAQSKVERDASRVAGEREAPRAATRTKANKPGVQAHAAANIAQKASVSQKAAEAAPAVVPESPADQAPNEENRNEGLVAAAGPVWPVLPNAEGASAETATISDAAQAATANVVQVVDTNAVNALDHAAAASRAGASSWITYLVLVLGAALVAASAIWFLPRMMYAR